MSKKSKKSTSQTTVKQIFDPSSRIYINGQLKTSAKSTKDGVDVTYNQDPYEKATLDYVNKNFYENLPNLNVFSDETVKNLNKQVEAFLNQGIDTINSTYTPMIRDMQNDVARRFGNTDNSVFMDNLRDIESKRAESIADLANSVEQKRSDLVNNELANRYNYMNFLNDYQKQIFNNMLSMLSLNNSYLNTNNNHLNSNPTTVTTQSSSSSGGGGAFDALKLAGQAFNVVSTFI